MRRIRLVFSLFLLLMIVVPVLAQDCPVNLEQYITRALRACKELDRNLVCYGNGDVLMSVSALYDDPDPVFANSGDQLPVQAFESVQVGASPLTADNWGITTLTVQANLLAEQPQRSSQFWLMGAATMQNAVPPIPEVTATATGTMNLRVLPAPDADIVRQLQLRDAVTANGRTEDNRWLRVLVPRTETLAWVSVEVLTLSGSIDTLEIVTPDTPYYRPFQIIDLQTGSNDSPCTNTPDSGLLIQTPNDINDVVIIVNGVTLHLKATVFIQAPADAPMIINVLNGWATIEDEESVYAIPAGARRLIDAGVPSEAESYVFEDFDSLPFSGLPYEFALIPPLTTDEIFAALNPPPDATPAPGDPDLRARCVRTLTQNANLRGGPGDFYEVVGEVTEGGRIRVAYESTDKDGYVWWQVYTGAWVRADYVQSTGDCDAVPVTSATVDSPKVNTLRLEACESDNGPIRNGQSVEVTFVDGGWESYGEAIQAQRVGRARIKVGGTFLDVYATDPFLVSRNPERWYIRFYAYWTATSGTFKIEGTRRYLALRCNITVPFGQ